MSHRYVRIIASTKPSVKTAPADGLERAAPGTSTPQVAAAPPQGTATCSSVIRRDGLFLLRCSGYLPSYATAGLAVTPGPGESGFRRRLPSAVVDSADYVQ